VTTKWPVLTPGEAPQIAPADWALEVSGTVTQGFTLDWAGFLALPQLVAAADMRCVTRWSRFDNRWEGVPGETIAALAGVPEGVGHVLAVCHGGYAANLPLPEFVAPGVMLAHSHDGEPLAAEHGGAGAVGCAATLWLEKRQVGAPSQAHAGRPAGHMGTAGLPQQR
jgi:DMSO/TMAO reductase YedYZ molybdopterin-dependent catalytic subunit